MPKLPKPFSFITWDECFRTGYDRFCQELWDWSDYVDVLYPPEIPFTRLPWAFDPALYDVSDSGENQYYREGTVSVWLLLSSDAEHYFFTEDPACEWEPFEAALFWDDLGFIFCPSKYDLAISAEPQPIVALLERFLTPLERYGYTEISHLDSFAADVIEACKIRSITKASGLYCAFDYDYYGIPVFGRFCSGSVEFLGSFSYNIRRPNTKP